MASTKKRKKKNDGVNHTRAIRRDRRTRLPHPPPDKKITALFEELIQPALFAQVSAFRNMGLRQRILTLPVMVAFVVSLIWRQFGSVSEAVRELNAHGMLWAEKTPVSQQAVSERLRTFPAQLFENLLRELMPQMLQRWQARQRPLPPPLAWAQTQFTACFALDGSTLDVLLRKVGLLRKRNKPLLAGRIVALVHTASMLPTQIWYEDDPQAHDLRLADRGLAAVAPNSLVLFDLGFYSHPFMAHTFFDRLTDQDIFFITRLKAKTVFKIPQTLFQDPHLHDALISLGSKQRRCRHPLRLIQVHQGNRTFRYLTNVCDPQRLPTAFVIDVYRCRWRIEDAFNIVKRLLGLAYFWVGSFNGVQVQVWATWLLYALLLDLTDEVAEELQRPFREISIEMVFRGLYHFSRAHARGETADPVKYLAENAKLLGIIKRKRKKKPLAHPRAGP